MNIPNRVYILYDSVVLRLRQVFIFLTVGAFVLYQHEELLDFKPEVRTKNIIKIVCLIILGLNGSPVSKDRKDDK